MPRQYDRCYRVTVYRSKAGTPGGFVYSNPDFFEGIPNGIEITNLQMEGSIEKSLESSPNTCTIKILNLNADSRREISRLPMSVRIEAGYDGEFRHLFAGDLIRGPSILKNVDWETTMLVADGSRSYRYARISPPRTYSRGTSVLTVLKDIFGSMGLLVPPNVLRSPEFVTQFAAGQSIGGLASAELGKLLGPLGYRWSIQNGRGVVIRDEEVIDGEALLIDDTSWLIGSPAYSTPTKPGEAPTMNFTSHLYPEVSPGKKIVMRSKGVNGTFKVIKVSHKLNFEGADWSTTAETRVL